MSEQVYHWQDADGSWQLARRVWIVPVRERACVGAGNDALVQHLYSNRLEWVPESKLLPYPASKIEEPTR